MTTLEVTNQKKQAETEKTYGLATINSCQRDLESCMNLTLIPYLIIIQIGMVWYIRGNIKNWICSFVNNSTQ